MKYQIMDGIRKLDSISDLNEIMAFVKECKLTIGRMTLSVGNDVWVVQKTKRTEGTITKVNRTRCQVDMSGVIYNVPMSMLELR